jgi:predicted nucleic acid-binding protein
MSKVVMIDSNIFIWGIKGQSRESQKELIEPAKRFINHITELKYRILMPAPQLGELLSFVPVDQQHEILSLIDKRFWVVPFDQLSALKFSELVYKSLKEPDLILYRQEHKVPKNKLKFDCMLIATAITRNVTKIYSNDPDIKKFAQNQVPVDIMPDVPYQIPMEFTSNERVPGPDEEL